jgi:hypothetical protein
VPWLWLKLLRQRFDAPGLHLIVKAAAAFAAKFVLLLCQPKNGVTSRTLACVLNPSC